MTSTTTVQIPGYVAGTWDIDAAHSTVGFSVRHMMVSKVRGYFREFSGEIVTAEDPTQSSRHREHRPGLDRHPAGAARRAHPLRRLLRRREPPADDLPLHRRPPRRRRDWLVDGELTIKGITKPVTLALELNGFGPDAYGGTRAGFSAKTEISRTEFGVDIQMPMDGGGVVVGDKISVELEIEAVLRTA